MLKCKVMCVILQWILLWSAEQIELDCYNTNGTNETNMMRKFCVLFLFFLSITRKYSLEILFWRDENMFTPRRYGMVYSVIWRQWDHFFIIICLRDVTCEGSTINMKVNKISFWVEMQNWFSAGILQQQQQ